MRCSLFSRLESEWAVLLTEPSTQASFSDWRKTDVPIRQFASIEQLVEFMQQPAHPAESDLVLQCLARRAPAEDIAARTLLQCVLYALPRIASRFRSAAGGDFDEAAALVVAAAYDRIRTYPFDRRPQRIAANIVLDTRQAVCRTLCRHRVGEVLVEDAGIYRTTEVQESSTHELVALVNEAVRRRRIDAGDARLVLLTRVLDVEVAELCATEGGQAQSVRRRRLRAEARLAEMVRGTAADAPG